MEPIDQTEKQYPLLSVQRLDEVVGVVALLGVLGSILWGVVSRYIFPQPATWTYEIALLTFGYLVFFGAVAGVRLRTHASIDVLVASFPHALQRGVVWFNYILLAVFFAAMTGMFAWQGWTARNVHTIALDLSRSLAYAPLALASAAMMIQHLIVERPWAAPTHG